MRDEAVRFAKRLEEAGIPVRSEVLDAAKGWPGALADPATCIDCPCAPVVTQRFREFFESTRTPPPH